MALAARVATATVHALERAFARLVDTAGRAACGKTGVCWRGVLGDATVQVGAGVGTDVRDFRVGGGLPVIEVIGGVGMRVCVGVSFGRGVFMGRWRDLARRRAERAAGEQRDDGPEGRWPTFAFHAPP